MWEAFRKKSINMLMDLLGRMFTGCPEGSGCMSSGLLQSVVRCQLR